MQAPSLRVRAHHDAGVVDEDVDALLLRVDLLGARPDRLEAGEVALVHGDVRAANLSPDVFCSRIGLLNVPANAIQTDYITINNNVSQKACLRLREYVTSARAKLVDERLCMRYLVDLHKNVL